ALGNLKGGLGWCEDRLLAEAAIDVATGHDSFTAWLQRQLPASVQAADLIAYFERRELADAAVLHRQGEAADTIDLIAAGHLTIDIAMRGGETMRMRRIMTHAVVGEMGVFRNAVRSATATAEGRTIVFTLTRASFERMRRERSDLAGAFYEIIVRMLCDRIDGGRREVGALEPLTS